jgi:hypothetical protein
MTWKPARTVEGRILSARRLNNSVNGNPRFVVVVHTTDGEVVPFTTSTDSASAFDVENVQRSGEDVRFGLTRADRIATISRLAEVGPVA